MRKQEEERAPSCGASVEKLDVRAGTLNMVRSPCRHELACLRIERNRAARHARGAIAKFTLPQ